MMKTTWHVRIFSLTDRGSRWLMVMGRLKPGATLPQAQANIAAIADHLQRDYRKPMSSWVWRLLGGAVAVQLEGGAKTCSSNSDGRSCGRAHDCLRQCCQLLLTRAASRRKEMAIRLALGGSRWRWCDKC